MYFEAFPGFHTLIPSLGEGELWLLIDLKASFIALACRSFLDVTSDLLPCRPKYETMATRITKPPQIASILTPWKESIRYRTKRRSDMVLTASRGSKSGVPGKQHFHFRILGELEGRNFETFQKNMNSDMVMCYTKYWMMEPATAKSGSWIPSTPPLTSLTSWLPGHPPLQRYLTTQYD